MRILMLYGQGGLVFSMGFRAFGDALAREGHNVSFFNPTRPDLAVDEALDASSVEGKLAVIGYSLGANAVTWVCSGWQGSEGLWQKGRPVDLAVCYDPTVNSYVTPLRSNVKRAILYHQTGYWGTSLFFGRGVITAAEGGPKIEEYQISQDHLAVQLNQNLHAITRQALAEA